MITQGYDPLTHSQTPHLFPLSAVVSLSVQSLPSSITDWVLNKMGGTACDLHCDTHCVGDNVFEHLSSPLMTTWSFNSIVEVICPVPLLKGMSRNQDHGRLTQGHVVQESWQRDSDLGL